MSSHTQVEKDLTLGAYNSLPLPELAILVTSESREESESVARMVTMTTVRMKQASTNRTPSWVKNRPLCARKH